MFSSEVGQSLKSYGHFSDLGVGIAPVTAMLDFSGIANTSNHGLGEGATANYYRAICVDFVVCCTTLIAYSVNLLLN